MKIGFSTGCFWKLYNGVNKDQLNIIKNTGCNAIELSATAPGRITELFVMDTSLVLSFEYISLHAPSLDVSDSELSILLKKLELLVKKFNVKTVVVHPDTVRNWDLLAKSNLPIGLENMDGQKTKFQSAEELLPILEKYNFRFVFDVNHIYTIDKTLSLAKSFQPLFKHLAHVHFSGMKVYDGFKNHYPAHLLNQEEIFKVTPKECPIIIESPFLENFAEQAQKEYDFVKKNLLNHN